MISLESIVVLLILLNVVVVAMNTLLVVFGARITRQLDRSGQFIETLTTTLKAINEQFAENGRDLNFLVKWTFSK